MQILIRLKLVLSELSPDMGTPRWQPTNQPTSHALTDNVLIEAFQSMTTMVGSCVPDATSGYVIRMHNLLTNEDPARHRDDKTICLIQGAA